MDLEPVEDVIRRLVDSGLEEKDARVAVSLAGREPLKASEIGNMVGITRMDAYNTLKRLQEKGLASSTVDRPMRFVGHAIADIFKLLISHEEEELRRLKFHLDELNNGSEAFVTMPPDIREPTFTVIKERGHIQASLKRLIGDAENEVVLILGKWGILHINRSGCVEVVNRASQRGVRVRVIAQIEEKTNRFYDELHDTIEIRHSDDSTSGSVLIDSDIVIQSMSMDSNPIGRGRDDSALIVESVEFLKAQRELVDTVWANSIDIHSARSRILNRQMIEPLNISLGEGSFYNRLREGILEAMMEEGGANVSWTNAVFRHQGEPIPLVPSKAFELMGIQFDPILRNIGRRIGEEIALEYSHIDDNDEFITKLKEIWKELNMGDLTIKGDPPNTVVVEDGGACGGQPTLGGMFCHLDEGILSGLLEARYGQSAEAVERECTSMGTGHCHYDIQFKS